MDAKRRILVYLEKFSAIMLDFRDVKSVGRGFADEIFRVFAQRHPAISISATNVNPVIDAMIRHAASSARA